MSSLIKEDLKQAGLKITQQRIKILKIFQKSKERHLSADDVYKRLQQKNQDVGIATIYRVLSQFESVGILQRIHLLRREQSIYELEQKNNHNHIICIKCHKVEEFIDDIIELRNNKAVEKLGGRVIEHSSVLYIKCKNCL